VDTGLSSNPCVVLDQNQLTVHRQFLTLLQHNQLATTRQIMALNSGATMRSVPGRITVRLVLKSPDGPAITAYLKRYRPEYLTFKRLLLRLLRWPGTGDEAYREWQMIHQLRAHGIPTAEPIAYGHSKSWGITTSSFVMTAEISGGVPGDEFLRTGGAHHRRQLLAPLVELTRRFHDQGFIHKDYYLAHVFVVPQNETLNLFLIDLQRVIGPGNFRERWLIKDLGSLAYSALKVGATRSDLLRFYKQRYHRSQLQPQDKQFIRKILRRVNWLFQRTPKYGESPIDPPESNTNSPEPRR
jgi:hypothetical protein